MNTNTQNQLAPINQLRAQVMHADTAQQLQMVLPKHIGVEKFQRVVMTAVSKNQDLIGADRSSLLNSCIECATDGLMPNGKEAALVIFNTNSAAKGQPKKWVKKVQYMPMIAGIYKLARNSGELKILYADIVYQNDIFVYEKGFDVKCEHKPNLGDPGNIRGVYAVAETKDGTRYADYMPVLEVEKVRATSKTKDFGPWKEFWSEMAKKTVVRRLSKVLPLTPEIERIVQSVDAMYDFENNREMQDVTPPPAPQKQDYIDTQPEHMNDALDGGMPELDANGQTDADESETITNEDTETETPEKIYRLISKDDIVIDFDSIDKWQEAAVKGINKLSAESSIKAFRERHGSIMAHLNGIGYEDQVSAVADALDAALKPEDNEPEM